MMSYRDHLKARLLAGANDPTVEELTVDSYNWDKRVGQAIGDSETLRELHIDIRPRETDDAWLGELLQHLPRNRSIKKLSIELFQLETTQYKYNLKTDIFRSLVPFIEHNSNLIDIKLQGGTTSMLRSLSSALSSCKNKRLERIHLHCNQIYSGDGEILTSLNDYNNLKEICVGAIKIETEGVTVLSNLLKKPTSLIFSLKLENNYLDDEHITILGNGLIGNKNVTSISFRENPSITAVGWDRFSQALLHPECAIEILRQDYEGVTVLGYALTTNKSIKCLDLTDNDTIKLEGLRGLLQCMRNPDTSLDDLVLKNCGIDDEGVVLIMEKVAHSVSLKTLNMSSNEWITSEGLITIYHAMFNCELSLQEIFLESNPGIYWDNLKEEDWLLLTRALCDTSSINNTYYSNHTIQSIEVDDYDQYEDRDYDDPFHDLMFQISVDRRDLMCMNNNENKVEVAREKIMKSHFAGEAVDISVFALMPEALLPHAIEWIGRDRLGFSLMYQFVGGYPLDFSDNNSSRAEPTKDGAGGMTHLQL
jgi:hypothetical protein